MGGGRSGPWILDACTGDAREPTEEVNERGGELVAADKPTVFTEPLLDAITMEHGQAIEVLPIPPSSNEGDWTEIASEIDYGLDQIVASQRRLSVARAGILRIC